MGKDYKDIGLNDQLMSVTSLGVTAPNFTTSTQFDANIEAGISAVKIPDSFKIAKTGTLQLSGADSSNDYVTGTVNHFFGTPPAFLAFAVISLNGSNQYTPLPVVADKTSALTIDIGGGTTVVAGYAFSTLYGVSGNSSTLFIYKGNALGSTGGGIPWSYNIKYYLLRETAT